MEGEAEQSRAKQRMVLFLSYRLIGDSKENQEESEREKGEGTREKGKAQHANYIFHVSQKAAWKLQPKNIFSLFDFESPC